MNFFFFIIVYFVQKFGLSWLLDLRNHGTYLRTANKSVLLVYFLFSFTTVDFHTSDFVPILGDTISLNFSN